MSNLCGGALFSQPFDAQLLVIADAAGEFQIAAPVVPWVPPGVDIWKQCIVQDLHNVFGITLSNAMTATTP